MEHTSPISSELFEIINCKCFCLRQPSEHACWWGYSNTIYYMKETLKETDIFKIIVEDL